MDRAELAAVPVLLREVGLVESVKLGWKLEAAKRRGEPFADLPKPDSEDERLSREQIGPAIVLYRLLREGRSQQEALRIARAVVIESALVFLRQSIGTLRRTEIEALDDEGRRQFVRQRGAKFFNATVEWDEISANRVDFTVTHCRFPPLCEAVGVPELAPVFCAGDGKFFGTVEPNTELVRPTTIAQGGATCPFSIRWKDDQEGPPTG